MIWLCVTYFDKSWLTCTVENVCIVYRLLMNAASNKRICVDALLEQWSILNGAWNSFLQVQNMLHWHSTLQIQKTLTLLHPDPSFLISVMNSIANRSALQCSFSTRMKLVVDGELHYYRRHELKINIELE